MSVVNLTPHSIDVIDPDGRTLMSFPPSGMVARCSMHYEVEMHLPDRVPVGTLRYGDVEGLPEVEDGVWLLVSVIVRLACPQRSDLLVPADDVRDAAGRVVGCRGLALSVVAG